MRLLNCKKQVHSFICLYYLTSHFTLTSEAAPAVVLSHVESTTFWTPLYQLGSVIETRQCWYSLVFICCLWCLMLILLCWLSKISLMQFICFSNHFPLLMTWNMISCLISVSRLHQWSNMNHHQHSTLLKMLPLQLRTLMFNTSMIALDTRMMITLLSALMTLITGAHCTCLWSWATPVSPSSTPAAPASCLTVSPALFTSLNRAECSAGSDR